MCQTERRPLTTLATFSTCLHSGKLSSFENSLSSLCDATACFGTAASTLAEPDPSLAYAAGQDSRVFSPSTQPMQPFSSPADPCAGVQNIMTCRSQKIDVIGNRMAAGPWLGTPGTCQPVEHSYSATDCCPACDVQYSQAADNSLIAYTTPVPPETATRAYQTSSYCSVDWTPGYQCSLAAGGMSSDVEDGKDHVCGSGNQLMDNCQSSDDWSSGVTAKKIKQLQPMLKQVQLTHGRRTTQAASRRASTGSLLYTPVSFSV